MSATGTACGGSLEAPVVSGIVSLKRRRSMMASGRVSAIRAETCVSCGRVELHSERLERLVSDFITRPRPS